MGLHRLRHLPSKVSSSMNGQFIRVCEDLFSTHDPTVIMLSSSFLGAPALFPSLTAVHPRRQQTQAPKAGVDSNYKMVDLLC